ncbi:MarR family winged helix-turn-helix transcriptional regulator [Chromobacterium amazonense]|uniref:MarR family transcriptional regulator n=1 Tax=Chromobacterium amazonense TaxID=1382803 RepID=A0A1S1X7U9_9NEIS|nr:MarR family transcriptional regulator [Chromobacterium amazonense]KIA81896.1 MarR family transcriptional regulator [Chromobacterium piscinae]MBM2885534.1 MarR family transcriptional regulator [Chromobacterium amazonense]MDE1714105.1 MarR family transcriptional regulator [Chromobacterium amazonense]MDQ4539153.1 MarR family transcriptional regulator [Chromobacterium amazonense]OHX15645.1 MarR family transcriptional regulator [Chromobacterium amazonense]
MQQVPDQIDRIVALWNEVRPDLDTSATEVIGRIVRMEYFITRRVLQDLARHNLNVGEFDVLAALRRGGEPYQLSPNQLQGMVLISSGALTNRINRLEEAGLVQRSPDPDDRRGVIVTLTPKGFQVIEDAAGHHLAAESELLEMLDGEERATLARLLKKMLQAQED